MIYIISVFANTPLLGSAFFCFKRINMGNIRLKQEPISSKKDNSDLNKSKSGQKFVLSDVSKEELDKRRIPVYSYLL